MIISTLIIANQYSDSPVKWFPSRQILTSAENGQNHTVDSNMYELKTKNWDDDNQCPLPCLYFRRPKLEKKKERNMRIIRLGLNSLTCMITAAAVNSLAMI